MKSWRFNLLLEWLRDWIAAHPEWMKAFLLNKQDKNKRQWEGGGRVDKEIYQKEIWGPFKPLPNVRKFKVELSTKDELFAKFGIARNFKPTFKYETYINNEMNKYAFHELSRLHRFAKEDPKKYWEIVRNILRYSDVFFIMALHHVEPKWHRDLPLWKIFQLAKKYRKIAHSKKWDVIHERKYIPKANGKLRPLGVPSLEWRLYLHTLNNFLAIYLETRGHFSNTQHGFRYGRGTKTAWEFLLKEVLPKATWIFEFDLERNFPNIGVKAVAKSLRKQCIPEGLISKLTYMSMTPVQNPMALAWDQKEANEMNKHLMREYGFTEEMLIKNPNIKKIPEGILLKIDADADPDYKLDLTFHNYNLALNYAREESIRKGERERMMFENGDNSAMRASLLRILGPNLEDSVHEMPIEKEIKDLFTPDPEESWKRVIKWVGSEQGENFKSEARASRGLPQGLPTSPLLTVTALEHFLIRENKNEMIMYADDGIFYGFGEAPSEEELMKDMEKEGIIFSREKSRWIRRNGETKGFKFLGLRFEDGKLSAQTRNGATLEYDKDNLITLTRILQSWKPDNRIGSRGNDAGLIEARTESSWEALLKSNLFGLIQSRMYQDSWEDGLIKQHFELDYKQASWAGRFAREYADINVFNSTSFASNSLLNLLKARPTGRGRHSPRKLSQREYL